MNEDVFTVNFLSLLPWHFLQSAFLPHLTFIFVQISFVKFSRRFSNLIFYLDLTQSWITNVKKEVFMNSHTNILKLEFVFDLSKDLDKKGKFISRLTRRNYFLRKQQSVTLLHWEKKMCLSLTEIPFTRLKSLFHFSV